MAYEWDNKKPTAQMLGRYQPWHLGHRKLFECIVKKDLQVNIQVKDSQGLDKKNPFSFERLVQLMKHWELAPSWQHLLVSLLKMV